jgi:hypothetical protein
MPKMTVDFTDVEGGFEVLPEGTYRAVVDAIERQTSQRSGEPMLVWQYKVTEGKHKGTIVYDFTSLQKQALFRLKQRLQALGYEVPDGPLTFDTDDLIGTPVVLQVGPPRKDNDGNPRTNLIAVMAQSEGSEEPEVEEEAEVEPPVKRPKKKLSALPEAALLPQQEDKAPWEETAAVARPKRKLGAKL